MKELEGGLQAKSAELHSSKVNLMEASSSTGALQSKYSALTEEHEKLSRSLETQAAQTQERKRQMKSYVDNLMSEKNDLERKIGHQQQEMEAMLRSRSDAENEARKCQAQVVAAKQDAEAEMTVARAQMAQEQKSEIASLTAAMEAKLAGIRQENEALKRHTAEFTQSSASEVQRAREQINESSKEKEEHKLKRMAARQEIVQLAQALEKEQAGGAEMSQYLQFNLHPAVAEQVQKIKRAITALDRSTEKIASGRAHKFKAGRGREYGDISVGAARNGRRDRGRNSTSSSETMMDHAMDLRSELDRLQVGLTLMCQSLERLDEVVESETRPRCCGGFFDDMLGAGGNAMVTSRPSKTGYAVLTDGTRSPMR